MNNIVPSLMAALFLRCNEYGNKGTEEDCDPVNLHGVQKFGMCWSMLAAASVHYSCRYGMQLKLPVRIVQRPLQPALSVSADDGTCRCAATMSKLCRSVLVLEAVVSAMLTGTTDAILTKMTAQYLMA